MSIAIRFGDVNDPNSLSGFIYFDATTEYSRSLTGKVTEHPIDAGASVTDHFISNNAQYNVSGVISAHDLSSIPSLLIINGESPLNTNQQPEPVMVNDAGSGLTRMIPGSVAQFLPSNLSTVMGGGGSRKDYKQDIQTMLTTLMTGLYYNEERQKWENRMTPITLYELNGTQITSSIENLILVDYQETETVDSGDALTFNMTFHKVTFVTLEKAEAPKPARNTREGRAASDTKNKGNVPSTPRDIPTVETPSMNGPRISSMGQLEVVGGKITNITKGGD